MAFKPRKIIKAEKDAREQNPALNKAYRRVEEEKVRYLEPVIAYFAVLMEAAKIDQNLENENVPGLLHPGTQHIF